VTTKYQKVEKLDELLKDLKLPYLEWKVLFLISDETSVNDIESLIEDKPDKINEAINSLADKKLINQISVDDQQEESQEEIAIKQDITEEMPASTEEDLEITESDEFEKTDEFDEFQEKTEEEIPESDTESVESDLKSENLENKQEEDLDLTEEIEEKEEMETEETEEEEGEPEILIAEDEEVKEEADEMNNFMEELGGIEEPESVTLEEEKIEENELSDVAPQEKSAEEPPAEKEVISDVSRKTILVVDDSIVIRKMVEIALEEEDYNIITSISGKEGMKMLDDEHPSLVILDMMLPDMNGIDVLKTIKASTGLPVIMLSGKDSPQLIENAKAEGADEFLPKPFRDEDLVEKVKSLLE